MNVLSYSLDIKQNIYSPLWIIQMEETNVKPGLPGSDDAVVRSTDQHQLLDT